MTGLENRLTQLEMLYSDQCQTVDAMSGEMFQQQKDITQLKCQIEELKEQMEASSNEIGGNERPPHY